MWRRAGPRCLIQMSAGTMVHAMKLVAELLNDMLASGVVTNYAVFGAVAQMRYTSAVMTMDADVLVAVPNPERLDLLGPIYRFCAERGYHPEGEAIRVGEWPVQLIPVFDRLTMEAMEEAETGEIDGKPLRVVRADYLAVIALSVGRPKDFARILALVEGDATTAAAIAGLAARHGLSEAWHRFQERFDAR